MTPASLLRHILYSLIISLCMLAILLLTTTPNRPPRWRSMLCFLGFAVAIAWISTIANEVVGVLRALGVILNMSDAILGLTIFAVGNSLGDLVADITVARLGFPHHGAISMFRRTYAEHLAWCRTERFVHDHHKRGASS